ncbi:MAG: UDP-N-acetylmuramoyl-tripeptide--D-alanyl-D-alanine ligase [Pseudomonadota bacterium]
MMQPSWQLSALCAPLQATLHGKDVSVSGCDTDSRRVQRGQLFVALRGERFDGHAFLQQAADGGAAAALVAEDALSGLASDLPLLAVHDTERGLGQIGAHNRRLYSGLLTAITGSCGKTSVKDMLSSIFATQAPTLATEGNLNNEIGVPLTLLRLAPEHRYAVIEMGAGKPGDIAYLVALGRPHISLLLNAMPAHLERMGSLQGIAETKGAILAGLNGEGHAVFPANSEFTPLWRDLAGTAKCLEFSFDSSAPVHVSDVELAAEKSRFRLHLEAEVIDVSLPLPGRHNVANAMAAGAAAFAAGISATGIQQGLASVAATGGRLMPRPGRNKLRLIDDSYNANPGSVAAAIDVLAGMPGRRVLVLGTMGELGDAVNSLHAEMGEYAAAAGIDQLVGFGDHTQHATRAFGAEAQHCADLDTLLSALEAELQVGDAVLVKGSRSVGMERVVAALARDTAGEVH